MIRSAAFKVLLVAGCLLGWRPALAENRVALVIGQAAYSSVVPLQNTTNDARMMGQLLTDAGFDATSATDLTQTRMREAIGEFAARIAAKGPDTVVVMFYAGHGLQVDGENFLIPVDLNPKREADVSLQAVRLNDVLNTLASVPSKMRIVMIDACRNNPFPEISKTVGHGLALVDAKSGASDSFLTYSTSPGSEAEDGAGTNSPYTAALLVAAREPDLSIEETFKRVRIAVNKATDGRQIPWESSSLTQEFRFFPAKATTEAAGSTTPSAGAPAAATRSVEAWRKDLQGLQPEAAYEIVVADNSVSAYQAFIDLFAQPPYGPRIRIVLERRYEMLAWNATVILNTSAAYHAFLLKYPDSDLAPTARKLEERMRNRLSVANANASVLPTAGPGGAPAAARSPSSPAISSPVLSSPSSSPAVGAPALNASLAAPTCPCSVVPAAPPSRRKALQPRPKRAEPPGRKRAEASPRRGRPAQYDEEEVVVVPSYGGGVPTGGYGGGRYFGGGGGFGGRGAFTPNPGGRMGGFRR